MTAWLDPFGAREARECQWSGSSAGHQRFKGAFGHPLLRGHRAADGDLDTRGRVEEWQIVNSRVSEEAAAIKRLSPHMV